MLISLLYATSIIEFKISERKTIKIIFHEIITQRRDVSFHEMYVGLPLHFTPVQGPLVESCSCG
jgi:hypothetical protein